MIEKAMLFADRRPPGGVEIPHEQHIRETQKTERDAPAERKAGTVLDNRSNSREVPLNVELLFRYFRQDERVVCSEFLAKGKVIGDILSGVLEREDLMTPGFTFGKGDRNAN